MSDETMVSETCVSWDVDAWTPWAIDRGTVIGALAFCFTLDGVA